METLYRKVAVSERKPTKCGTYFSNEGEVFYSSIYKEFQHDYDPHTMYPDWWLEPIESHQLEKLETDKAELLEALEELTEFLQWVFRKIDKGDTPKETVRILLMNREKIDNINFELTKSNP